MQDLASEFSKIFRGNTPGPSQREGAIPSRTQHPARPCAPVLGPKAWSPQLFSRGCAPGHIDWCRVGVCGPGLTLAFSSRDAASK